MSAVIGLAAWTVGAVFLAGLAVGVGYLLNLGARRGGRHR